MRRESDHLVFASCFGVHCDPGTAIQDIHFPSQLAHPHFFAHVLPGHRIAASLPVDIRIASHLPQLSIDVGVAQTTSAAVPPGRDKNPVRVFRTFTEELERLADWLVQCVSGNYAALLF
jgi:hypothetical protein